MMQVKELLKALQSPVSWMTPWMKGAYLSLNYITLHRALQVSHEKSLQRMTLSHEEVRGGMLIILI